MLWWVVGLSVTGAIAELGGILAVSGRWGQVWAWVRRREEPAGSDERTRVGDLEHLPVLLVIGLCCFVAANIVGAAG